MMPGLAEILKQCAASVPLAQRRLDDEHLAAIQTARDRIRALVGTAIESIAKEISPARYMLQETEVEIQAQTSEQVETGFTMTPMNSFYWRRYARQRSGSANVRMTIRSSPMLSPQKGARI
jgi:hypothetical protein